MPQLDIYTYFTQFQWLLVIFTLLFLLINGQFIPTFQSLFEARNALLGSLLDTVKNPEAKDAGAEGGLKGFEFEKPTKTTPKPTTSSQSVVSKWDQIYDKYATARLSSTASKAEPTLTVGRNKSNESLKSNPTSSSKDIGAHSTSVKKGKAQSNKKGTVNWRRGS